MSKALSEKESPNALVVSRASSWGLLPALGNLDAYIRTTHQLPLLTPEEEISNARLFRATGDLEAAKKLVLSHLRLVVSISRQYAGYGLPLADLIEEGNIGLMKAVKRFDPEQGVRLVSYAVHWIKAEINEYVVRNWRMVKVATTKAQRKLFFNLRSIKAKLMAQTRADGAQADAPSLFNSLQAEKIAHLLDVKASEVYEMETRLTGSDVPLEGSDDDHEDAFTAPIHYLSDHRFEPTEVIAAKEKEFLLDEGLKNALDILDERSRNIVKARWLEVDEDGRNGKTLQELAQQYGVSLERIRQIEVGALKKMREHLQSNGS